MLFRPKSPKNPLKPPILRLRSSKVVEFDGNREPVYDFVLVIKTHLSLLRMRLVFSFEISFFNHAMGF